MSFPALRLYNLARKTQLVSVMRVNKKSAKQEPGGCLAGGVN